MSCCSGNKCCDSGPKMPQGCTDDSSTRKSVSNFYADELGKLKNELPTVCAIDEEAYSAQGKLNDEALSRLHPDLKKSSFGCGTPFPPALNGCHILDLGAGTGRDVFVLSYLVGPEGSAIGVDMTPQMVETANGYKEWHKEEFGYGNTDFKLGVLESLEKMGLEPNSFDVIVSNCVINLTTDKKKVFASAYDLLKLGGELFFSDVYTDNPLPESLKKNELAYNACYSGALPWTEFESMVKDIGFAGPFTTRSVTFPPFNEELAAMLAGIAFYSRTCRLVKPICSDPPKTTADVEVTYNGSIKGNEESFNWDKDHIFKAQTALTVPSDIASTMKNSRYAGYFKFPCCF